MEEKYKYIKEYYSSGLEENRFTQDKAHRVEFITTTSYIDKYVKEGDHILEVGAGTGAYSIHYAKQGYKVDSLELVNSNIDIFKSKITDDLDINIRQGTALDLSCYEDNTFDVTLVLGPLYHLYTEEDKNKAIEEALRVTKEDGYIYIAYLTNDSVFLSYCLKKHHLVNNEGLYDSNYKLIDNPKEVFSIFYIEEFDNLMKKHNVEHIKNVMTDGLSTILREHVNDLSEEEFKVWVDYHLSVCERKDLQGYSSHMLYIGKKKKKSRF